MLARDTRPVDFTNAPQLIIAPVAVLAQWKAEIESKTTKRWRILIHHGQTRAKSAASLKQYDIVLTSYGTLRSEVFPHGKKKKKQNFAPSDDDDDDEPPARTSPLAGTKWFRVILDEAHYVSLACCRLLTSDPQPWHVHLQGDHDSGRSAPLVPHGNTSRQQPQGLGPGFALPWCDGL